ncbi:MAG TPA: sugar phosphate isomerase/epimerase [Nitrososphaerales archaeon]|nr:sugar phosphate isomerase/epimerase [Nitrososphaerales archaeon]
MKIGLSTWSLLHLDVNSAVREIGNAGFDGVELWGEVPHAYPDWTDRKALRDTLSSYSMLVTMHAPFTDLNPASPFQPVKGAVERTLDEFIKFSAFLGAKMVTVHPGSVHNEALVPQSTESAIHTLKSMTKAADGRLSVNVENQTKSRSPYHFPLASNMESLQLILSEIEGSKFTFDTGHAFVNGQDLGGLVARTSTSLVEVHLSDNGGAADEHLIPGEGKAPLKPALERLKGSDVYICLELDPHRYAKDQVLSAARSAKELLA